MSWPARLSCGPEVRTRQTALLALEVFELLTLAERRLASTRESPPARPAPDGAR